ncbi:hypothetical protein [Arthrobacter sp. A5]|uniref:hypothetical protein n=1 Tax=Arthrobacter sp. A5 TaxID=576926 RepID=UPI003DA947C4
MAEQPVRADFVAHVRSVREAFPERRVIHQSRPSWLGQQSLDIYLPDQNIGIEYQARSTAAR